MFPMSQNDCSQYKEYHMDEVNHHSSFATSYYKTADTNEIEIGYKYQDQDQEPVLIYHKQQNNIQENNEIQHKYSNINAERWTTKENSIFVESVDLFLNRWTLKQCMERWYHLKPDIKNEPLSEEEQNILDQAHNIFGDNWTEISRRLPGRNDSYVKNHLNAIKQVEDAKKKSMNMVKIKNQPNYIFEGLTTPEDELDGHVPMTFNDDYELYGLEFYPEAPMKQEINFMKMLCGNL